MIERSAEGESVIRDRLIDLALVAASVAALLPFQPTAEVWHGALGALACAAVLVRRWNPLIAVALTVPGFLFSEAFVPVAVTLATFALHERRRTVLIITTGLLALAWILPERPWEAPEYIGSILLLGCVYVGFPVAFGMLVRTRRDLADRIAELLSLRTREQIRAAEDAVAAERGVLAREMHDVVSHYVSVIAVQAAALQIMTDEPQTRITAGRIRSSAAVTIEELQAMVHVLRHTGGATRHPRRAPTATDLRALIAASDLVVYGGIDMPVALSLSAQHAVYRFIQEGLTNAMKHASGAPVTLSSNQEGSRFLVSLTTERATASAPRLPSSGQGLLGLRERAEILGGTVTTTHTVQGTHELVMSIPLDAA